MAQSFDDVYKLARQLSEADRRRLAAELAASPVDLTVQDVLATLNAHVEELHEKGIKRIGVFGSYVRGEARLDSDIDILVTLTPPYSLFDLAGVQVYLEDLLGRKVDVSPEDGLKPGIRQTILDEVIYAEGV